MKKYILCPKIFWSLVVLFVFLVNSLPAEENDIETAAERKNRCDELLKKAENTSPELFTAVLSCELEEATDAFAAADNPDFGGPDLTQPSLTNGDLSLTTFPGPIPPGAGPGAPAVDDNLQAVPITKLDLPAVKPVQPTKLNLPAVKPAQPIKLNLPVVTPGQPIKLNLPVVTPGQPTKLNLPAVKPAQPIKLDLPAVKPAQPTKLNLPAVKPAQPTKLNLPAVTPINLNLPAVPLPHVKSQLQPIRPLDLRNNLKAALPAVHANSFAVQKIDSQPLSAVPILE